MSKLPAFQFYPGDWRKDMGVQSLSFHDRGVWWEMLCLMHESERRGVLILNGAAMSDDSLCRLLGLDKQNLTTTLTSLLTSGVASREDGTGAIYSRRMVRDENLRKVRAEAGSKGGNPILLNQNPTTQVKQIPTPSSSVSSSTTKQEQKPSRVKRERKSKDPTKTDLANARHAEFKAIIGEYWDSKNAGVQMPWDGREGKHLEMFLRAAPDITAAQFRGFLRNRFKSEVNHGERASQWIDWAASYAAGPIDRFGKTIHQEGTNGANQPSATKQRVDNNRLAIAAALAKRGIHGPWDNPVPHGEAIPEPGHDGGAGGIHGRSGEVGPEILPPER